MTLSKGQLDYVKKKVKRLPPGSGTVEVRLQGWEEFNEPATDRSRYSRRVFAEYAHMDCFIGRRAAEDDEANGVYAWILDRLRRPPGP